MVYVRLVFLASIATLWEVSECRYLLRRVRPCGLQPCVGPRDPRIVCSSRYERALENIISKLIQALVVTNVESGGSGGAGGGGGIGGGGGGSGSGSSGGGTGGGSSGNGGSGSPLGSLLGLDVDAIGRQLLDLQVLPESIGGSGSGSSGGSGGTGGGSVENGESGSPVESLLGVTVDAIGQTLLDLQVLPDNIVS